MYSRIFFFFFLSRTSSEVNCFDHSAPPRAMPLAQPSYLLSPFLSSFLSLYFVTTVSSLLPSRLLSFHSTSHTLSPTYSTSLTCVWIKSWANHRTYLLETVHKYEWEIKFHRRVWPRKVLKPLCFDWKSTGYIYIHGDTFPVSVWNFTI